MRTSDARDGFLARQIGDMNKSIIERSVDVRNAEDKLALCDLWTEGDGVFFLGCLDFFGGLASSTSQLCDPSFLHRSRPIKGHMCIWDGGGEVREEI